MTEQVAPSVRSRPRHPGVDMVRSLGLVAVLLIIWLLLSHPRTPERAEVQWRPVTQAAAASAAYQVLAPADLAWPATAAWVHPHPDGTFEWRAGFLDPAGDFASVVQRGDFPDQALQAQEAWIADITRNGEPGPSVELGGREWTRMVGDSTPDRRHSLVSVDDGVVTAVTGSADWASLEGLAASLRPVASEQG